MPKCKNCNADLSRLDKEVCPFCGTLHPFEGIENQTEDLTKAFDPLLEDDLKPKHKKRIVVFFLAIFLGIFGVHLYYMGKFKKGLIVLGSFIGFEALAGLLIFFLSPLNNVWAFLIPYFVFELLMIITGVALLLRHDIVDSHGDFLE